MLDKLLSLHEKAFSSFFTYQDNGDHFHSGMHVEADAIFAEKAQFPLGNGVGASSDAASGRADRLTSIPVPP